MPDLMYGEADNLVFWHDELCSSCLSQNECPLVAAVLELELATYGGVHVMSCKRYDPDVMSMWYVDPANTDVRSRMDVNMSTLQQQLEQMLGPLAPNWQELMRHTNE